MGTQEWGYGDSVKAAFEQMDRVRRWQGMLLDAAGFAPQETPHRLLPIEAGVRLRAYGDAGGPALLVVPAPIKRCYIWDLAPQVSVVRDCLRHGIRVYVAEWMPVNEMGQDYGLHDYAERLLTACLDAIETDCGQHRVIQAGHSLGGALAAISSCLHPERVAALVLLEAPLHFAGDAGKFAPVVGAAPDAHPLGQYFGCVPGSFLNAVCVSSAPEEFHWQRLSDLFRSLPNAEKLATHMRVERWMHDEFAMPGRLFADVIELLYRHDQLMRGQLSIGGRRVGPRDLAVPLLNVINPNSTVIAPQSILPFHQAAASASKKLLSYGGDVGVSIQHVGVLAGANAHARMWPAIFEWLARIFHQTGPQLCMGYGR